MSPGATPANPAVPMLVPDGAHAGQRPMTLNRVFTLIGSAPQARLYLQSKSVSRCHAVVINTAGGLFVRDLASRTGTIVNGRPVREHDLREGDVVQVGTYTFRFTDPSRGKSKPGAVAPGGAPPAGLEIEGLDEPVELDVRVLLIGRRETCDISLTESSASSAHALILQANGRHVLRDLNSRTGTLVNGTPVHEHSLAPGDSIKVGETRMRYVALRRGAVAGGIAADAGGAVEVDERSPEVDEGATGWAAEAPAPPAPPQPAGAAEEVSAEPPSPDLGLPDEEDEQLVPENEPDLSLEFGPEPTEVSEPQPPTGPVPAPVADAARREAEETFDLADPEGLAPEAEPPGAAGPAARVAAEETGPATAGRAKTIAVGPEPAAVTDEAPEPTLEEIVDALRRKLAPEEPAEGAAATEMDLLGVTPAGEDETGAVATDPSRQSYPSSADTIAAPPPATPAEPDATRQPSDAKPQAADGERHGRVVKPPAPRRVTKQPAPPQPAPAVAAPTRFTPPAPPAPPSKPPAAAPRPAAASPLPLPEPPPGLARPPAAPRPPAGVGGAVNLPKAAPPKPPSRPPKPRPARPRDPLSLASDPVDLDLLPDEANGTSNGSRQGNSRPPGAAPPRGDAANTRQPKG